VKTALAALFEVEISNSRINRLRREASEGLKPSVVEAEGYVQQEAVLHSDETSFGQGNSDGHNPAQKQGWLWVLVTPMVSVFSILLSCSQAAAQALIGPDYSGIVISDRYSGYSWIDIAVRDGALSRTTFAELIQPIRAGLKALLEEGASYTIGPKEKAPLAKTVRTCQQLLQVEPALWTFVTVPGVEPTNNVAERTLRPGVIWKHISFGSESLSESPGTAQLLCP
jgi:transposase